MSGDIKETADIELCYIDVGGTFTDAFLVNADGEYSAAKAPSTPEDVSGGFINAVSGAAEAMGLELEDVLRSPNVIIGYGATLALNALLTRRGGDPGLLITKGFRHLLYMGRGKQSWTELDRADRIHPQTHRMLEPLIPLHRIEEISERSDCLGLRPIPVYEEDVRAAAHRLVDEGVDSIVVMFLWSFLNAENEQRARAVVEEVLEARGADLPIYLASDISPVIRETPRVNAAVIEAYCGPFNSLSTDLRRQGFAGDLQVMQSAGGLASARNVRVIETIQSGPVGGLTGGRFIGEIYDFDNIITTDVGGTSFDLGLVTNGIVGVNREPTVGRFLLGVPMAEVMSIGAGGGTKAGLDPLTGRLVVGRESAGANPGPVCYGLGGQDPTVTDADLILGYLQPDGFAGGNMTLDVAGAHEAVRTQIADPLGLSVEEAAHGIRVLIDTRMRESIHGLVVARGFDLSEYHLLSYGGAGPAHVAGYTDGVPVKGILMFPYSSVFSAFGASSADYEHNYSKSVNLLIPPDVTDDGKQEIGTRITEVWAELKEKVLRDMEFEGFAPSTVEIRAVAMMRYGRQLNDLTVSSPTLDVSTPEAWDSLVAAFEELYSRIYSRAATYSQAGFEIFEVAVIGRAPKCRPQMRSFPMASEKPSDSALVETRQAYFENEFVPTSVWDLGELAPGNSIAGPAVIRDPHTTIVVPPGREISMDQYRTMWMNTA
jgi:acetone carboxylase beta subunit